MAADVLISGTNARQFLRKMKKYLSRLRPDAAESAQLLLCSPSADVTVALPGAAAVCGIPIVWEDFSGKLSEKPLRCGLGSSCDLTFSSIGRGRLMICLLRPVRTLSGGEALPGEFPLRASSGDAFPALAAAAVAILCENLPE